MSAELQGVAEERRGLVPSERQQEAGVAIARRRNGDGPVQEQPPRRRRNPVAATLHYFAAFGVIFELPPRQRLAVLLFTVTDLLENTVGGATTILIIGSQLDLHLSPTMTAFVASSMGTLNVLASPVMGYYGDRLRRRPLLLGGAAVQAVACAAAGRGGLLLLIVSLLFMNLGGGLAGVLSGIRYSMMSDLYPPEARGRIFTVQQTGGSIGTVIGPTIGALLVGTVGWRGGFLVGGFVFLLAFLAYLPLREPARGAAERIAAGLPAQAPPQQVQPRVGEMVRAVWSVRTLRRMYLAYPALVLGGGALFALNFYRLETTFGVSVSGFATLTTVAQTIAMVARLAVAPLVDRFTSRAPSRNMALVGSMTLLTGVLTALLLVVPVVWLVFPLFLIQQAAGALMGPAQAVLPSLVLPPRVRTFGLSLMPVWGLPSTLVAIPLVTALYTQYGLGGSMAVLLPVFLFGAFMYWSAQAYIGHDMRAARAAAVAEAESTEREREGRKAILVCRDVDVTYSGVQVLFGVDFDVAEGEIVALLGTNGAGKSTMLRAISGLTEASNGAIFFDGRDITHMPPQAIARTGVVMVLGGRAIFPNLTVEENLQAATWTTASDREFVQRQMHRVLDEFFPPLKARLHERAGTLSGGEQQMLALGQAFLMKPRLLMIDELSLGLAPAVVEQLLQILRAIHAGGTTIILVEQSVNLALTVADRAVFMEKGEVQFVGPTAELLRRPDVMRSVFLGNAAQGSLDAVAGGRSAHATAGDGVQKPVVLEAHGLRCRFGGVEALRGVDLTVHAAEIVGIIGANGAGKTTFFDALSGFVPLTAGTVRLAGQDVTLLGPDARARLGLTRSFQDARLFSALTVRESILLAMERHGAVRSAAMSALWLPPVRQSEAKLKRRADLLIEVLGLQRYADWFVGELSTGTRRIADIACTMAAEPDVLLLDEPSSGVAQAEVQELGPLLQRLRAETGCAMLVIEHDMSLIATVSDRLVAMELGTVMSEGRPEDVLSDARVVASYLGTSKEAIARTAAMPV